MYLLYSEYQDMGGTLDEAAFNEIAYEAQSQIDWYTFSRLQNEETYPEAVKRCMYKLIKLIQAQQSTIGLDGESSGATGMIASQSNDGVSISYNVLSASDAANLIKEQMEGIVQRYLQGVKNSLGQLVLYRGLYTGE